VLFRKCGLRRAIQGEVPYRPAGENADRVMLPAKFLQFVLESEFGLAEPVRQVFGQAFQQFGRQGIEGIDIHAWQFLVPGPKRVKCNPPESQAMMCGGIFAIRRE
jgi:hypothetical protein